MALPASAIAFLREAARRTPVEMCALDVTPQTLMAIEHVHGRLIAMHLEKELRSARVLRELRPES